MTNAVMCNQALEEYMRQVYKDSSDGDIISFESFWSELSAGELKKLWWAACRWQEEQSILH